MHDDGTFCVELECLRYSWWNYLTEVITEWDRWFHWAPYYSRAEEEADIANAAYWDQVAVERS